ncbi:MAG: M20/M25/M40 family metallo-hydrolase, partial [Deltaproteobacteria bacterium]
QWTRRTGAPEFALQCRRLSPSRVRVRIEQIQNGAPFRLRVPVALTVEGKAEAQVVDVLVDRRVVEREIDTRGPALRADLDPEYDVFRRLADGEVPPTVADLFGSARVTFVLPAGDRLDEWRKLGEQWGRQAREGARIVGEDELTALPRDGAVWIFGAGNRWGRSLAAWLEPRGARIQAGAATIGGKPFPLGENSFVVVGGGPTGEPIAWLGGGPPAALQHLARKLPHYGRYSYLVFQGDAADNVAKGRWEAVGSPLSRPCIEGVDRAATELPERGVLPARRPLARPKSVFDARRLLEHVRFLAADELEGRGVGTSGLDRAADYIAAAFRATGLEPGGAGGSYFDEWTEEGGPGGHSVRLRNVVGVLPGANRKWSSQSVVVGAHYDHLGRGWPQARAGRAGEVHNGADDNASGVAVLLELARFFAARGRPERTIVFVAFSGEEWGRKGSRRYVETMTRWPAKDVLAMVNLDTVGRLGDGPLLVLGTSSAREWPHIVMGVQYTIGVAARAVPSDPGGSDHTSFRELGIPAVQLFTGAHEDYHLPSDDVEKIDGDGLSKVASFAAEMLAYLASREERLTVVSAPASAAGGGAHGPAAGGPSRKRRAGLGTLPDYTYGGPGVRVADVTPGSPAAHAGILAGDVVVALGGKAVPDLRAFAAVLAEHEPGERVSVTIERGGRRMHVDAVLEAR